MNALSKRPDDLFEEMGAEFREEFRLPYDELKNRRFAKIMWFAMAVATAVVLWSTWLMLVGWR